MCVSLACSYLCNLFPFRFTGNKGTSSSMEQSAGIIVPNPLELLNQVVTTSLRPLTPFTPIIKAQPSNFLLQCIYTRFLASLPSRVAVYISPFSPSYTRVFPPCSEPLTTHLRLLRTTTSPGSLQLFFTVHSFSYYTPSRAIPSKPAWLLRIILVHLRGLFLVVYSVFSPPPPAKK